VLNDGLRELFCVGNAAYSPLPGRRVYIDWPQVERLDSSRCRQGLAVSMASAVVVLKHETSTLRQSNNFISINFTVGVGDYTVRRSPALPNLVRIRWAVETLRGGMYIRVLWLFFFNPSTELQPIPVNRFSRTIAQKTRSGARKTLLGWEMCSCEIWRCLTLKTSPKIGLGMVRMGNYTPK